MFPDFYDSDDVAVRRPPEVAAAMQAGLNSNVPASNGQKNHMVMGIDMQGDFIYPNGALPVPGAVEDAQRFVEYIYRNVGQIDGLLFSMDKHNPYQIFLPTWWESLSDRLPPEPYTTLKKSEKGRDDTLSGYVLDADGNPEYVGEYKPRLYRDWSVKTYPETLEDTGQPPLMIWPPHCMIGAEGGSSLIPGLLEAITYVAAARQIQPQYMFKGSVPQSEHYGIFQCCVPVPGNPQGGLQTPMLDAIGQFDRVTVAGQAEDFCVRTSMQQLLDYYGDDPDVLGSLHFLKDCTSPVIDDRDAADAVLDDFTDKGVNIITSTD